MEATDRPSRGDMIWLRATEKKNALADNNQNLEQCVFQAFTSFDVDYKDELCAVWKLYFSCKGVTPLSFWFIL